MSSNIPTLSLKVEFSGGLELLFSKQRSHTISIPPMVPYHNSNTASPSSSGGPAETKTADINYLIHYLRDHLLKERPELFMEKETV